MDDHEYGGIPADFRQLMAAAAARTEQQLIASSGRGHVAEPYSSSVQGRNVIMAHNNNNYLQQSYPTLGAGLVDHFGSGHHRNHNRFSVSSTTNTASNGVALYHHELESSTSGVRGGGGGGGGGDGGGLWPINNNSIGNYENNNYSYNYNEEGNNTSRWPRQETLTLLEIRSRLNSRFKDTNQKGPLWDQISRIMAEEHGYQRSGKKCKEKFENLYKYYKKTKEGKAGRQDGKHYRFFRQLEAIYGDQSINQPSVLETYLGRNTLLHTELESQELNHDHHHDPNKLSESLSFSINNSSEFETSSSDYNNEDRHDHSGIAPVFKMNNTNDHGLIMDQKMKGIIRPRNKSSWKVKVEEFVDSQMKKIMVTQETWMEKMLKSVIDKEEERVAKEEEWRKQEAARFDQEVSEFWSKEKAWVEARDAALMGALNKFTSGNKGSSLLELPPFPERMLSRDHITRKDTTSYVNYNNHRWNEEEISSLVELIRSCNSLEATSFQGTSVVVWEEIASKMVCLGFDRSAAECKEKWESLSVYVRMTNECKKNRREDYKTSGTGCYYFDHDRQDNREGYHHDQDQSLKQGHDHQRIMGLQLMDEGLSPSSNSNVGTSQMHPSNCFHLLFGEGENLWEKYGTMKLSKDKINQL
ncbi:TFIIB transcription factor [Trema orientale]|uniref:TFIIB transcription factor n=1 Tax=Trema orientale TaxID=63057 RepID=A0A2P5EHX2_TREOI|nr:TFIIB transcription factor [Trema orientale]